MLEINGKNYEVHNVKLTKKDLKNLKKEKHLFLSAKKIKKL